MNIIQATNKRIPITRIDVHDINDKRVPASFDISWDKSYNTIAYQLRFSACRPVSVQLHYITRTGEEKYFLVVVSTTSNRETLTIREAEIYTYYTSADVMDNSTIFRFRSGRRIDIERIEIVDSLGKRSNAKFDADMKFGGNSIKHGKGVTSYTVHFYKCKPISVLIHGKDGRDPGRLTIHGMIADRDSLVIYERRMYDHYADCDIVGLDQSTHRLIDIDVDKS